MRLQVVLSDVEREGDDAEHAANPRPRHRGDCGPLSCPHCAASVLMRLGEDDEGNVKAECPECGGRVHEPADYGAQEWVAYEEDVHGRMPIHPRLLNHCRPCAFVGCTHHLFLDVMDNGQSIRLNFPDKGPEGLAETCALDVADRGGCTLDEVGKTINITRERVRQLLEQGIRAAKKATNPMFSRTYIDMEDSSEIGEVRHALEDAE